ncbi:phage baseplate assembly protein [Lichenihabitans sp. PAMC28606]|uniref:phage baseplate assembly protein n=1 Tax=Lichenihabitans sp. PAMC28606 TaxID=2880932 RepID=UPI001D09AA6B|nr:phage baseplate assembly protein [Lichenihabitans sp. PAMC28606]UDL95512.1 phage baseplate assembly protein [Lichenihabitans sp. PAMC28606]
MTTSLFRIEHIKSDDTGEIQTVDAYGHANETLEGIIRTQPHGFTSNPPVGSHGIGLALRGIRTLAVALGLEHPDKRIKNLKPGQTAVYDDQGNSSQYLGTDGIKHDSGQNPHQIKGKTLVLAATGGSASLQGGDGEKTYIGGDGKTGTYAAVMTEDGPSQIVFARIS